MKLGIKCFKVKTDISRPKLSQAKWPELRKEL